MGTAVGLTLGFALLRQPIQVVAVRVTDPAVASPELYANLYAESADLLNSRVEGLSLNRQLRSEQLNFVEEFYGNAYAEPTVEALNAIDVAATAGITLDGTYTGKAFAALLAHRNTDKRDGPVLFWCTLNAINTPMADETQLAKLGEDFARYR